MDFLSGYNSGSDSSSEIEDSSKAPTTSFVTEKEASVQSSKQSIGKKRKLDLSYFPLEIQHALSSGNADADSDEEFDAKSVSQKRTVINKDDLLMQLPMPKDYSNSGNDHSAYNFTVPKIFTATLGTKPTEPVLEQKFIDEKVVLKRKPNFQSNYTNFSSVPKPTTSNFYQSASLKPSEQVSNTELSADSNTDIPVAGESSSINFDSSGSKKRRAREIELQLMKGDLETLNSLPTKDIQADHSWDSLEYMEQQEREASIQRSFSIGTSASMMQPTKNQNRKHQLTSLVFRAAQTELALLDAKSHRMKTKAETQRKYGW